MSTRVSLFALPVLMTLFSCAGSAQQLSRVLLTTSQPPANCVAPQSAAWLTLADSQMVFWFLVDNVPAGQGPSLILRTGDGTSLAEMTWQPVRTAGSYCFSWALPISTMPRSWIGRWSARVNMGGQAMGSFSFPLYAEAPKSMGVVTTVAGTDWSFSATVPPKELALGALCGLASDSRGNTYVADLYNQVIVRYALTGPAEIFAGNGRAGYSGDGGPAVNASFFFFDTCSLAFHPNGALLVPDTANHRIRAVYPDGRIETFAGTGQPGFSGDGGAAKSATLQWPTAVAVDRRGNVFIADSNNFRIRRVTPDGGISTYAGTGAKGYGGDGDDAYRAVLDFPRTIATDDAGNLFIGDNARVRRVSPEGVITTVAGTGVAGYSGDGGPATAATLDPITGLTVDNLGRLYVGHGRSLDTFVRGYSAIRRIAASGVISTLAGNGDAGFSGDGGPATLAKLNRPAQVALDQAGNLLIADGENGRVRRVSGAGTIETVAGNGGYRFGGDKRPAPSASFFYPSGINFGPDGSLLIADTLNNRIRRVGADGLVTTVAGKGARAFDGDGGPAIDASLRVPHLVAPDRHGNIFIEDVNFIRRVSPDGLISIPAILPEPITGLQAAGSLVYGSLLSGRIFRMDQQGGGSTITNSIPQGRLIALTADGVSYVSDQKRNQIWKVQPNGNVSVFAGSGLRGLAGDEGPATEAAIDLTAGTDGCFDREGNFYFIDSGNLRIRRVDPRGIIRTVAGDGTWNIPAEGRPALETGFSFLPTVGFTVPQQRGLAITDTGVLHMSDPESFRIFAIRPGAAAVTVATEPLTFVARSGGDFSSRQTIPLTGTIAGLAYTASVSPANGASWLRVSTSRGQLPATVEVWADPTNLPEGTYEASIVIDVPAGQPARNVVAVRFTVAAPAGARMEVSPAQLTFDLSNASGPESQTIVIANRGSGAVDYSVNLTGAAVRGLGLASQEGTVTPVSNGSAVLTVDPTALAPGSYATTITVSDGSGSSVAIPVTINVSTGRPVMRLSQKGLAFETVEPAGTEQAQPVHVLNVGTGVLNWTASAATDPADGGWLVVTPAFGTTDAEGRIPELRVSVRSDGLRPRAYRGRVLVTPAGAGQPQTVDVVLDVLPSGTAVRPSLSSTGVLFTADPGAPTPGSPSVVVFNPRSTSMRVSARAQSLEGGSWFSPLPLEAVIPARGRLEIRIHPDKNLGLLSPGVREGVINLNFGDGEMRQIRVVSIVTAKLARQAKPFGPEAATGCNPAQAAMVFSNIGPGFIAVRGRPVPLEVRVADECASAFTRGSVVLSFSNGDPAVPLTSLRDGRWTGTWVPQASAAGVTVKGAAEDPTRNLRSQVSVDGAILER